MPTDRVLSLSATIIAFCAICISIWQGNMARQHNRLSLAPYITSAPEINQTENKSGVYVYNDGTGPAFIKKAFLIANGKTFDLTKNSWSEIYKHLDIETLCHYQSWFKEGTVLRPAESIKLLSPEKSENDKCYIEFIKLLGAYELDLHFVYDSIYKEEYQYKQRIGIDIREFETYKSILRF